MESRGRVLQLTKYARGTITFISTLLLSRENSNNLSKVTQIVGFLEKRIQGTSLVVQLTLRASIHEACVWSLTWELRSCMLHSMAKNKVIFKKKKKKAPNSGRLCTTWWFLEHLLHIVKNHIQGLQENIKTCLKLILNQRMRGIREAVLRRDTESLRP